MKKLNALVLGLLVTSALVAFVGCTPKADEATADGTGTAATSNVKDPGSTDE